MSTFDDLFESKDTLYNQWNLTEIPFAESAEKLQQLNQVFTGRRNELSQVINQFSRRDAKIIFVCGWIGIGKTAFVREVLEGYDRNLRDQVLTASIKLEPNTDLATAALIALAREMPNDDWAQFQLNRLGLRPDLDLYNRTTKAGSRIVFQATVEEHRVNPEAPQYPKLIFDDLLDRAMKTYGRVIIAIDDLDKQAPAVAQQLLLKAHGLLKGRALIMLTGHPSGIIRDHLIRDRGLFDLTLELGPLDAETSYTMLQNYLASARRQPVDPNDEAAAVHPFTPNTARELCRVAEGVPRWLNRMASYVLLKAFDLQAPKITPEVLQAGLTHARQKLKGQPGLTPQDYYVFEMVLEKRVLSDDTITLAELEKLKVETFSEIMPILDKLVATDMLKRLPTERATAYAPMPLLDSGDAEEDTDT